MPFCWPSCYLLFCLQLNSLSLLSSIGWYCGAGVFGLIGWQSPSPGLALPIFFNNNNNNNNNTDNWPDEWPTDYWSTDNWPHERPTDIWFKDNWPDEWPTAIWSKDNWSDEWPTDNARTTFDRKVTNRLLHVPNLSHANLT